MARFIKMNKTNRTSIKIQIMPFKAISNPATKKATKSNKHLV